MSKIEKPQITTESLLKLFEGKKMKEARFFLDEMKQQNPQAEDAIIEALKNNLCDHKASVIGISSALFFYKSVLLSAEVTFFDDSQIFPQQIHNAVINNCRYKAKINWKERGKGYFSDILKLVLNSEIQSYGNYYITLSLEIVQSMAQWYPKGFYTNKPSRFAIAYQTLLKEGIQFPPLDAYAYIKVQEKDKFKNNYEKIKAEYDKQISQISEAQQKTKSKPLTTKQPIQEKQKSKVSLQSNDPNFLDLSNKNLQSKVIKKNVTKPQVESKKIQTEIKNESNQIPDLLMNSKVDSKLKVQIKNHSIQKQVSKKNQSEVSFILTKSIQEKKEKNKETQKQQKPLQNKNNNDSIKKLNQRQNSLIKQNIFINQTKNIQTIKSKKTQRNVFIVNKDQQMGKNTQRQISQLKKQQLNINQLNKQVEQLQLENQILKAKIDLKAENRQEIKQPFSFGVKKAMKMQHYQHRSNNSPLKNENYQIKNQVINKINPKDIDFKGKSLQNLHNQKRKSMPKIQKRNFNEFINPTNLDINKPQYDILQLNQVQTLSQFMINRKLKNSPEIRLKQFVNANILSFGEMKLDEYLIPFIPQYFEPIKVQDKSLRKLCLHLNSSIEQSNSFYSDNLIECRLIKVRKNYILSFNNKSTKPIKLAYQFESIKNKPFCQNLKIHTQQTFEWVIEAQKYLDFKFSFKTSDLNFKFLQMSFKINQALLNLVLPITILDQCEITQGVNLSKVLSGGSIFGKVYKSPPFLINDKLPYFMHQKSIKGNSKLKGEFEIVLKKRQDIQRLGVFIFPLNSNKNMVEIKVIFDNRIEQNQDFAKVILQLLIFLLYK